LKRVDWVECVECMKILAPSKRRASLPRQTAGAETGRRSRDAAGGRLIDYPGNGLRLPG
jgi:hypothetical protein